MKNLGFIFCHGWGFNSDFWLNLCENFKNFPYIFHNLDYFNEIPTPARSPVVLENYNWVGIGHSLGFLKLLQLNFPLVAIIGLQGFTSFLGNDPLLHKTRNLYLQRMIKQFTNNHKKALDDFYQACGMPHNEILSGKSKKFININKLLMDLNWLAEDHSNLLPRFPCLILGSENDTIVPTAIIKDNFSIHPNIKQVIHPTAMHCLGYAETDFVTREIFKFI